MTNPAKWPDAIQIVKRGLVASVCGIFALCEIRGDEENMNPMEELEPCQDWQEGTNRCLYAGECPHKTDRATCDLVVA